MPKGVKKEEKQHTHMTSAIVNMPNLPGLLLPFESVVLRAKTKLTSEISFFFASLSPLMEE